MVAGETTMAIALADSLFLSISPDAARTKVIMFLAVSMAPFAVVAPLVGPFIDRMRGGQRAVVILVGILRAVVLLAMARYLDSLTLFPLAFAALILGKTYSIAKSALVPSIISDKEKLVASNSKLGQVAGITGFVMAIPAGTLQLVSAKATLTLGALAYLAAALNAYRLPKLVIAKEPAGQLEIRNCIRRALFTQQMQCGFCAGPLGLCSSTWLFGYAEKTLAQRGSDLQLAYQVSQR